MCRSKIGVQCIESKKKLFSEKTNFRKKKNSGKNAFFRRKNIFDSMHWVPILLLHISKHPLYTSFQGSQKQIQKKSKKQFVR
jgi:hypothetical protein